MLAIPREDGIPYLASVFCALLAFHFLWILRAKPYMYLKTPEVTLW